MTIVSQKGGELCCSFNPGVWIWYSQCDSHQMLNVKLGKVQIDNQLTSTELPTRVIFSEVDSRYTGELAEGMIMNTCTCTPYNYMYTLCMYSYCTCIIQEYMYSKLLTI